MEKRSSDVCRETWGQPGYTVPSSKKVPARAVQYACFCVQCLLPRLRPQETPRWPPRSPQNAPSCPPDAFQKPPAAPRKEKERPNWLARGCRNYLLKNNPLTRVPRLFMQNRCCHVLPAAHLWTILQLGWSNRVWVGRGSWRL